MFNHINALVSHARRVMLKILQARFPQYMNRGLPDVQAGFRKGRGTRDQVANISGSQKKQENSRKTSILLHWLHYCLWLCGSQQTGKFLKRWEYQITWPASWETCMPDKKQQLELDMGQWTVSKLGKEYIKSVYCHPPYLTYMQSNHEKCQAGWSTSWNQDSQEKCQQPQIGRWYNLNGRKLRGTKEPFSEGERREWKSWLKTQH